MSNPLGFALMVMSALVAVASVSFAVVGVVLLVLGGFKRSKALKLIGGWCLGVSCLGITSVLLFWVLMSL